MRVDVVHEASHLLTILAGRILSDAVVSHARS